MKRLRDRSNNLSSQARFRQRTLAAVHKLHRESLFSKYWRGSDYLLMK